MPDRALLEKLKKIERLHAGAGSPGEKAAAADALARITRRLQEVASVEPSVEYTFRLTDEWSKKLFVALLRRYSIRPYRRPRQGRHTVMARLPKRFVDETLWPEFLELSRGLLAYLDEVTDRVIAAGIHAGSTDADAEDGPEPAAHK